MPGDTYTLAIELFRTDGEILGRHDVHPDFEPARDWLRFEAMRVGRIREGETPGVVRVEPRWDETLGAPHVGGFDLRIEGGAGAGFGLELGIDYLTPHAETRALALVKDGSLAADDLYRFRVFAYPATDGEPGEPEETPLALGLTDRPLTDLTPEAVDDRDDGYAVLVPEPLIEELKAAAIAADGKETGGLLIGRLYRDPGSDVVIAELTGHIPARHVEADSRSLVFTPETWADARRVLRLRDRGEILLGWQHLHPMKAVCRDCPPEKREGCSLLAGFFSVQDRHLHRTAFPGAHSLALVVTELSPETLTVSLFGWRRGRLVRREFRTMAAPVAGRPLNETDQEGWTCRTRND